MTRHTPRIAARRGGHKRAAFLGSFAFGGCSTAAVIHRDATREEVLRDHARHPHRDRRLCRHRRPGGERGDRGPVRDVARVGRRGRRRSASSSSRRCRDGSPRCPSGPSSTSCASASGRACAGQPGRVVLHQLPHAHRGDRGSRPRLSTRRPSVNYLLWIPFAGFCVWIVIWRVQFEHDGDRSSGCRARAPRLPVRALAASAPTGATSSHQATHPSIAAGERRLHLRLLRDRACSARR